MFTSADSTMKTNDLLQIKFVGTVSCQTTPEGKLKSMVEKAVNKGRVPNSKIMVIEDAGKPITAGLKNKDPFRKDGCIYKDPNCMVKDDTKCDENGVVYKIVCKLLCQYTKLCWFNTIHSTQQDVSTHCFT